MEIGATAWPYRIHDPAWRVGMVSAGAGASTAILLGLLLIYILGTLFDDGPAIWIVSSIGALMTAFSVVALGLAILDVLELRVRVSPDNQGRYDLGSSMLLAKVCVTAAAATILAVSAYRTGSKLRRSSQRHAKAPSPLIVGSAGTPEPTRSVE
jgi:hypothetical protein